jgi:ATP-dependent Clp protease ATP-binding subunit ClpX
VPPEGGRKHPLQECIEINTANILFIGGGSFEGIEDIVKQRLNTKGNIGFNTDTKTDTKYMSLKDIRNNITINDLKKYGMIPELLGRFNVLTNLEPLELDDLINILKLKTGYIEEYKTLFNLQDKQLIIEDNAYEEIASIALNENIGARGLKYIIEKIMFDIMFNAPSENIKKYVINNQIINNKYFEKQLLSA